MANAINLMISPEIYFEFVAAVVVCLVVVYVCKYVRNLWIRASAHKLLDEGQIEVTLEVSFMAVTVSVLPSHYL